MANIPVKNAAGATVYLKSTGTGTDIDPYVPDPATTVTVASGGIASGSVASGAVASGAVAAGAIVDGANVTQGALADAAVVTDASGSLSAKLRGIIKLLVDKITVKLDAGTNLIGKVSIDQATANANEVVVKSGTVTTVSTVTAVTGITNALPAGTNLLGKVGIDQATANANEVVIKSALPAGTAAIGKLAANNGVDIGDVDVASIAAGNNNIGDVDIASIAAGTNIIGNTRDAGPAQTVSRLYTANADFSTARDVTAAPTGGQKIVLLDLFVSVNTACLVTVQMETSANVLSGAYLPANGTIAFTLRGLIKADAADKKILVKTSAASAGVVTANYYSEA